MSVASVRRRARALDARVLRLFLPGDVFEFYCAEVQRQTGLSPSGAYNCLQRLQARGALQSRRVTARADSGAHAVRRYYRATPVAAGVMAELKAESQVSDP